MANDGFRVDMRALQGAEEGIRGAVAELGEMGSWGASAAGAEQGMGLAEYLFNSGSQVGHEALGGALIALGQAWEPGVRYLIEDGNAAVKALGEARAAYQQMDAEAAHGLETRAREL